MPENRASASSAWAQALATSWNSGGQIGQRARVVGLALQIDHGAAGGGGERVGEGLGAQAEQVHVVEKRGARRGEAHAAQFGHDAGRARKRLRAQPPAHARSLVHHGLQAQLHQLVGCHQTRHARAHDGHFLAHRGMRAGCPGRRGGPTSRRRRRGSRDQKR